MVYFYEIGVYDSRRSDTNILCHSLDFEKEEFNKMVLDAFSKANNLRIEAFKTWLNDYSVYKKIEQNSEIEAEMTTYDVEVSDLIYDVIEILVNDFGFYTPNPRKEFIAEDSLGLIKSGKVVKNEKTNLIYDKLFIKDKRNKKIENLMS